MAQKEIHSGTFGAASIQRACLGTHGSRIDCPDPSGDALQRGEANALLQLDLSANRLCCLSKEIPN